MQYSNSSVSKMLTRLGLSTAEQKNSADISSTVATSPQADTAFVQDVTIPAIGKNFGSAHKMNQLRPNDPNARGEQCLSQLSEKISNVFYNRSINQQPSNSSQTVENDLGTSFSI